MVGNRERSLDLEGCRFLVSSGGGGEIPTLVKILGTKGENSVSTLTIKGAPIAVWVLGRCSPIWK